MILIAHRGDTTQFSENTIEAFDSAFNKGADGVELDVQFIDNQLVIVHDYQFETDLQYPRLEDVLEMIIGRGRLEIEIKSFSLDILEPMEQLFSKYDTSNIELTSTELPMINPIKEKFPNINVGVIFGSDHDQPWMTEKTLIRKTVELMKTMQAQVAHISSIPKNRITSELIQTLHGVDIKAHYHISESSIEDQLDLYNWCKLLGFDQCTFDDIELLDEVKKTSSHTAYQALQGTIRHLAPQE